MAAPALQEAGAAAFAPGDELLPGLLDDLGRIAGHENDARGDAFLAILRERGLQPAVQVVPNPAQERDPRPQGRNLIVTVGRGDRDLVVGAHYDAVRTRDGLMVGGVVDNGAGALVLTHVARTLRDFPLRHRVRVVLFDLEEVGLLGSAAYVAEAEPGRTAAMINLDIAAYGNTLIYGPSSAPGNTDVYRSFRTVCAVQMIPCVEFPSLPRSDDRSFQEAGIPNISLAILPAIEAHQGWLLLNAGAQSGLREGYVPPTFGIIHSAADRLELAEPAAMTRAHNAIVALVLELDARLR